MPTASIYVRLSKKADDRNLSLSGMLDDTRALAARLGYDVAAERVDDGISGAVRSRPAFQAWLEDGRSGRVDAMLTWSADRLTREGVNVVGPILDIVEGEVCQPVRLVDVQGLDSDGDEKAKERFREDFIGQSEDARKERRAMRRRNKAARERMNAEPSRFPGGPIPFGTEMVNEAGEPTTKKIKEAKYLRKSEAEAAFLAEVAGRLVRGDSLLSVTRWANEQDMRPRERKGRPVSDWSRQSIRNVLTSATVQKMVFTDSQNKAIARRLSPAKPTRQTRGGRPQERLLAGGVGTCASCHRPLTTSSGRYVCPAVSSGERCQAKVSIQAAPVDEHVEAAFLERWGDVFAIEGHVVFEGAEEVDAAETALEAARVAMTDDPTDENVAAFRTARTALDAAQAIPVRRVERPTGRTNGEVWAASDVPERAAILRQAADSIEIRRGDGTAYRPGRRGSYVDLERVVITWRDEVA